MKRLISYFIKYSVSGNILILLLLSLGWVGLQSLRSTQVPEVDPGTIKIMTRYPGASPLEVEQGIVLKIEDNLQGIEGVKRITSISQENLGTVVVEVVSGENADLVLAEVKNAIDGISSFPSGIEPPTASKAEFKSEAIIFALSGDLSLTELKSEALKVEDELLAHDEISKIELTGFTDQEIEIAFHETVLHTYGITIEEAVRIIRRSNLDLTGGVIRGDREEFSIRANQKKYYARDLGNIIMRAEEDGGIVRLKDVALLEERWADDPDLVFVDGNPAALFQINYSGNEDLLKIAGVVEQYLERYNAEHNITKAQILTNYAEAVRSMQSILLDNGAVGFLLVVLFLSVSLNPRFSFWVALSIPLSFMGMFALVSLLDITLNRVSLFGMILVIGILVDDGIVIAENIYRHTEMGKNHIKAAIDGALEVLPAVFSAVITTMIAFSTFLFIDGTFGQFYSEMATVVILALLVSLVEGALILPGHIAHSKALSKSNKPSKIEQKTSQVMRYLSENIYRPLLSGALNSRLLTLTIASGILLITIAAAAGGFIQMGGSTFENQNFSIAELRMPPGTPAKITLEALAVLEQNARKTGEQYQNLSNGTDVITSIVKELSASNLGSITVNFIDSRHRDFISTDFSNSWRGNTGEIANADLLNYKESTSFGKAVSVSLMGDDISELDKAVKLMKSELKSLSGLKNIVDDNEQGMREVKIVLKDYSPLIGLDISDVMTQVRDGFFGSEVQRVNRGTEEIKIWVRYAQSDRSSLSDLEDMRIRSASGEAFRLKDIADIEYASSLSKIRHLNGKRQITVEANALNKAVDLSKIKAELATVILPRIKHDYPGTSFHFGGREERRAEAAESFKEIVPIIVILLFAIIAFTFRSMGQAALIFLLLPFGFIGVGWGHVIHSTPIDMPSYFGIIALIGVLVNDSIVLIETLNRNLKQGMKYHQALLDAGSTRFRPIILTSLTTVAGLAPLILANNPDAQQTIPMAIAVAYGMLVATAATLIILPALLSLTNNAKQIWFKARTGQDVTREEIEMVVKENDIERLIQE
jgi:multidrug efflux pump subunit AcrB